MRNGQFGKISKSLKNFQAAIAAFQAALALAHAGVFKQNDTVH
jgi:hypothetical protein